MSKTKECIAAARQALNLFTGDELERYIQQVSRRTKELQEQGVPFARDSAIKEINNVHLNALYSDAATAARNIEKFTINKKKMDEGIEIRSFLEKTSKNTDYNIETASNAAKQTLYDKAFSTLNKEHIDLITQNELTDEIYAFADGIETDNPMIRAVGTKLKEYIEPRNSMLIKSNAMQPSELNEDRFFRNTYDPSKLSKLGKDNFIAAMRMYIDIKKTFKDTRAMSIEGEINDSIVNEMLGNSYDNIIQGNGVLFTKPVVAKDWAKVERSRHMFYVYKDWRSWGAANKELGQDSLMQAWMMDINTSGRQIGMAEIMGSAPEMMYNKMREIEVAKKPNTALNSLSYQQNDALFKQQLGVNKAIYNPTIANIGSASRQISSMARLGSIVLRSIPDVANIGGIAQRAGSGFWSPMINRIVHTFDLIPSEERKTLARTMASALNTHMGVVSRYSDTNNIGGLINKLSNRFFHTLGLEAWDKGNKLFAMEPVMKAFGKASSKSLDKLNRQQQSFLIRFNISEIEWDALRAKTEKRIFSTDNVINMTDTEIKDLWNKSDKSIPLSDYKSSLYRKVFGMFDVMHEFSVLNPTDYIKMITTGNTVAGTVHGELMRMITQFKGYPIQYMRRVWVGGMQDFDSYQAKFMYALNMSLATIALTTLADALVSISKGYTPANPANMSNHEKFKYYTKMLAGGMGIFGTILNDKDNAKNIAGSLIATPSMKLLGDPLIAAVSLATGNLERTKKSVKDFVNVANPIGTVPIASPFIDAFLGNKPYLEPGQRPLF